MTTVIEPNFDGLIVIILAIMFGPPLLLFFIGYALRKTNEKAKKVFYILAIVYLILGLGICGSMMI